MGLEQIVDAEENFGGIEGLADEILGAQGKRLSLDLGAVVGGDHQHGQVVGPTVQHDLLENLKPVLPAHVEIEQDEIRPGLEKKLQRFVGVGGRSDALVPCLRENSGEQTDVLILIVDDEYPSRFLTRR